MQSTAVELDAPWRCQRCHGTEQNKFGRCATCWEPLPGPQTRFLSLTCREALYGGAAGGGKSDSLLVDAIRYVGRGYGAAYAALLLRREFPELEKSLIARSWDIYPLLGGRYNEQKKVWKFPGGEKVHFGHLQHENDVVAYQGAAFCFIGFDELTTFLESQYRYLLSRLRSARGIPLRIRGATNPGGSGHGWVFKRFGPWLDPDATYHAQPGEVVEFVIDKDGRESRVTRDEAKALRAARAVAPSARERDAIPLPLGRCFVPAVLADNPFLADDGEYARNLAELPLVTREQLRNGNWLIKPAAGLVFKRAWFAIVAAAPVAARRIRYWDRAATAEQDGNDPDWTVGLKLARTSEGLYFVENVIRLRGTPAEVEKTIVQTAQLDGIDCEVGIEQDPGSAGKFEAAYYIRALDGFNVHAYPVSKDKVTRSLPASAQAEAGNIKIVAGTWNEEFLSEAEQFPSKDVHDDQVDTLSGAFAAMHEPPAFVGTADGNGLS